MTPLSRLRAFPPRGDAASGLAKPAPRLLTHGLLRGLLVFRSPLNRSRAFPPGGRLQRPGKASSAQAPHGLLRGLLVLRSPLSRLCAFLPMRDAAGGLAEPAPQSSANGLLRGFLVVTTFIPAFSRLGKVY